MGEWSIHQRLSLDLPEDIVAQGVALESDHRNRMLRGGTPALRWSGELRYAMTRRDIQGQVLAKAAGLTHNYISTMRRGRVFPIPATAAKLAQVLDWPELANVCLEIRTRKCAVCGKTFIDNSRQLKAIYCSRGCSSTAHTRRRRGATGVLSSVLQHQMIIARKAVGDFCRSCEPEGICRDAKCPLRPVSPLPTHYGSMQIDPLDVALHRRAIGIRELRHKRDLHNTSRQRRGGK